MAAAQGIASGRGLRGREAEINQELERRNGRRTQGFFVPDNGWKKRAYVAGTATAGGNLIATDHLADNLIMHCALVSPLQNTARRSCAVWSVT